MSARLDQLELTAGGLSGLCLVHCVALPLVSVLLPGLGFAESDGVHLALLTLAAPLAIAVLAVGRRRHAARWPLAAGTGGLVLMGLALLAPTEVAERVVAISGGAALIAAHVGNWRLRHADCPAA